MTRWDLEGEEFKGLAYTLSEPAQISCNHEKLLTIVSAVLIGAVGGKKGTKLVKAIREALKA